MNTFYKIYIKGKNVEDFILNIGRALKWKMVCKEERR
jgi:hypothetical protein